MSDRSSSDAPASRPSEDAPLTPLLLLQEEHDRLKATLAALPDILFVVDRDGLIYDFHAPHPERLYVPPEKFLGRKMDDLLPEPAAGVIRAAINETVATGRHQGGIYPLTTSAGERWFEMSIAAQGDPRTPAGRLVFLARDITDRKQAETELEDAYAWLQATLKALPDILFVVDRAGRILDYHAPRLSLRRIPPEQFLGKTIPEVVSESSAKILRDALRKVGEEGTQEGVVFAIPLPEGERWYEASIAVQGDPQSPDARFVAIARDIHDRKQTAERLRENEARFNQSARQSRTYLWEVDADGLYTFASPVVEDVLGYRPEDIVGHLHCYDLFPEKDREALKTEIFEIIRGRGFFRDFENPCQAKDGRVVWVITSAVPLLDADGTLRGYRGSDTDITARKQMEEQLRESEERLAQSAQQSRTVIWEVDADGLFTFVSPVVEDVLGYRPEELVGHLHFYDLYPEENRAALQAAVGDAFRRRETFRNFESMGRAKDGQPVWIVTNAIPLLNADGTLRGYRGGNMDITARKRAEEALRESEQKYRLLTEDMKDVVWVLDVEAQRFLYVSPSVEALRGYTPAEILAQPLEAAWLPAERKRLFALLRGYVADFLAGIIDETTYVPIEFFQPCKDGSTVPSEAICRLVRNEPSGRLELHGVTRDISRRVQAETALRESETRFNNVAQTSRSYVWEVDVNGLLTYISPVVEDVLGYPPEEIIGRMHFYDFQPPECQAEVKAAALRLFHQAQPVANFENANRTKDGRLVWVSSSATPLFSADGSLRGHQGVDFDITERKQAEEALRASEAKYRQLHEAMRDPFARTDLKGHLLEFNPAFQDLLGYSKDELLGMTFRDITPRKWHAHERKIMAEQVKTRGFSSVYEKEYVRKDGSVVPVELRTMRVCDAPGNPAGMAAIIRDISERKRSEQALREAHDELERRVRERTAQLETSQQALAQSEAQFRQMTGIIQEVFWLVDAHSGQALYVSPAFEQIWGRPPRKDSPGVFTWVAGLHPEDRDRALRTFARGLEAGVFDPLEVRVVRPDGSIRWIDVRGWLIRPAAGEPPRVAGVMRDITERRRLEAEILRTAEAERQRIGRDLHDSLGQALTGIGYLAEAVREELARHSRPEAADVEKLGRLIEDAAGKAHALAQDMLLADLKRGGLAATLQELASRTQELFGVPCRYEGLAETGLTDPDVTGQLYRIAQEAATNAAKHAQAKTIEIRLAKKQGRLWLTVRDTGKGFAPQKRKRPGMGLDIMRYRAGMIGATLAIVSAPGQGTVVSCHLPLAPKKPEMTP